MLVFLSSCATNNLVNFANNYEEVARTSDTVPTLSARILRLREFGECINSKCPKEKLYIAISEFGEYPEQRLYITDRADEWRFVEWNYIPKLADPEPTIIFTILNKRGNKETLFYVKANIDSITYEEKERWQ